MSLGFNVTQLANKLERLALATPHTTKVKPDSTVVEEDFDLKERPDSADSDSGRPVTSNDSSIYRSFVVDCVENQQLDSLDFSSTLCHDDNINDSSGNTESVHENLALINLDLVSSDFEDSSQNLTSQSFSNKSAEGILHNSPHHSKPMENVESEKQFQV